MSELIPSQPWKSSNSGRRYTGHIAVGRTAVDTLPPLTALAGTTSAGVTNDNVFTDGSLTQSAVILNTMSVDASANNAANWIAQNGLIEIASGNNKNYTGLVAGDGGAAYHYGTGTITELEGVFGLTQNNSSGIITNAQDIRSLNINYGSGTITNHYGLSSLVVHVSGTSVVTTHHGLHLSNPLIFAGSVTNNYGGYIESQNTGSSVNYGLVIGLAGTNTLWLSNLSDATSVAGGIVFGASKDTNVYRSAANTLKTDDAFIAALGIQETAVKSRVVTVSDATSITPNNDTSDTVTQANTQAAGTLTINAPSGTAYDGQELTIRIKSTNVQTFSFNAIYVGSLDTPLPVSTYASSTWCYMKFVYNATDTEWHLLAITDGY